MPQSSWNVAELDGSRVETEEGEFLGLLVDVIGTGANDVFVIRDGEKEVLIPALKSVVLEVLLSEKKITVRLPQGWRDIYEAPKKA